MIRSKLPFLRAKREMETGQRLSYKTLAAEVGVSKDALIRLMANKFDSVKANTLDKVCRYFGCELGELLEYVPDTGS